MSRLMQGVHVHENLSAVYEHGRSGTANKSTCVYAVAPAAVEEEGAVGGP